MYDKGVEYPCHIHRQTRDNEKKQMKTDSTCAYSHCVHVVHAFMLFLRSHVECRRWTPRSSRVQAVLLANRTCAAARAVHQQEVHLLLQEVSTHAQIRSLRFVPQWAAKRKKIQHLAHIPSSWNGCFIPATSSSFLAL
jgi:hypothetical protein